MSSSGGADSSAPQRRATIYDVARLARVNPSTVSRALGQPGRLNAATEQRIHEAARELDYRINPFARALPTGRTQMIGLLLADITNPVFFNVVRGAERYAAERGYTLLFAESQESGAREAETAERVLPSVDALILGSTRLGDDEIAALAARIPLAVINRRVDGVESVVPNIEPGIAQALDHLTALGHRRIAYLAGPPASWMSSARGELLAAGSIARGVELVETGPAAPTIEGGTDAFAGIAATAATAVIAYNDLMAIGLLQAALGAGLRVPGELSILGFDDIFGSSFTSPALSTVRTPLALAGERAVRLLLERLAPETGGASEVPAAEAIAEPTAEEEPAETFATELVVRGSTGLATG